MATKTLSVVIKAVDKATSPVRSIGRSIVGSMKSVFSALTSVKALVTGLIALLVARRLINFLDQAREKLDQIAKTARQFGFAGEELSVLRVAADRAGVSFSTVGTAVRTVISNLDEFADRGTGEAARAVQRLDRALPGFAQKIRGVDGVSLSMQEKLELVADALANVDDQTEKVALAMELFGRRGAQVVNIFGQGSGAIRAFAKEAEVLGVVFSERQLGAAERLTDAIGRVKDALLGFTASVLARIEPVLEPFLNKLSVFVAALADVFGKLADLIVDAFGSNEVAERARERIENVLVAILRLVVPAISAFGVGIALVLIRAVEFALNASQKDFIDVMQRFLITSVGRALEGAGKFIDDRLGGDSPLTRLGQEMIEEGAEAWAELDRRSTGDIKRALNNVIAAVEDTGGELDALLGATAGHLRRRASELGTVLDEEFGFIEDMRGRFAVLDEALVNLRRLTSGEGAPATATGGPVIDFLRKIQEGAVVAGQAVSDISDIAIRTGQTVATSVSQNLTSAIFNVIDGTTKLKDAFKDFAASTLRQISQVITQMLILNAVSKLIGGISFGGGASAASSASAFSGGTGTSANVVGGLGALANLGGVVETLGSIRRFNLGSIVPGPNVNRDLVLAALSPGERVLSRQQNRRFERGMMGGGGVTISVGDIIIQGGASRETARSVQEAVKQGVLSALDRSPSFREQMRQRLS